jgi:branched-chain amino acid transport system permease protein
VVSRRHATPVLVVLALAALPFVVTSSFWMTIMAFAGIYAIACMGLTLLFGYANQLSLGHAGFYGIGAYVSAILSTRAGLNTWLCMLVGAAAASVVAYVIGRRILRLRGLSLALITIAFGEIMLVLFTELEITGAANGLSGIPSPTIGSFAFVDAKSYYWLVLAITAVVYVVVRNITRSAPGRRLRAAGMDPRGAESVGIDIPTVRNRAFAFSAFLAGLAGALFAHYSLFVGPESFTVQLSFLFLLAVCIGGRYSVVGTLLGALFMSAVPSYLGGSGAAASLIYGGLLVLIFMFAPNGLTGLWTSLWGIVTTRGAAGASNPVPDART